MPAAAVIPAPIAYTNVVAVKKLVVGFQIDSFRPILGDLESFFFGTIPHVINFTCAVSASFTLRKLECSKQL